MCSEPQLTDVYILGEKLGSGTYSVVRKGIRKTGRRQVVAVKCIPKSRLKNKRAIDNILTEIELLKSIEHEHIVQMLDFMWDKENIYLILEYCPGGDLSHFIRKQLRLPELVARRFLQQLAQALAFLRERSIVHMDLKPQNIMIVGEGHRLQLKLADFGFAKYLDPNKEEDVLECRGSPLYMAPEFFVPCGAYTAKCDLWSVGVILYECLFGKAPYHSTTFRELEKKLTTNAPIELPVGASISADCEDLLHRLLQRDPDKRIDYEEFFQHPFVDLDHAPSARSCDLATKQLCAAVEADKRKRFEKALELYSDGLSHLVAAVAYESDERKRTALREKVHEYMARAEKLRELLNSCPKNQRGNNSDANTHASLDEMEHRFAKLKSLSAGSAVLMSGVIHLRQFHKEVHLKQYSDALRTYERLFESVYPTLQELPSSECKTCYKYELNYAMTMAENAKEVAKRPRRPPLPKRSLSGLADEEEACRKSSSECSVM